MREPLGRIIRHVVIDTSSKDMNLKYFKELAIDINKPWFNN